MAKMMIVLTVVVGCGKAKPTATPVSEATPPTATPILPTGTPIPSIVEPLPTAPAPAAYFEQSAQAFPSVPTFQIGLGDLDGDGDLDAVFANGQSNFSTVWLNGGDGHFADTGQQLTQQGHGVGVGDLDDDGDLDLFFTCHGTPGSDKPSRVYLNDGNGVFYDNGQDLGDVELSGNAVHLVDIDTDGDLDAIVAYYERGNAVYLNDGNANFALSEITFPTASIWGDLDSDGDVDVFSKEDGVGYQSMLNDGTGNFAEYWAYKDTTAMIHGDIGLGDTDDDGDLDAIVTNGDWRSTGYPALVFLNDGSGQFTDSGQRLSAVRNASVNLGDLNGDGYLDLVFTDFEEPNQIWINDGTGQFIDSGFRFGAEQFYRHAHLGDLDQDGDLDIFLATFGMDCGPNEVWFNNSNISQGFLLQDVGFSTPESVLYDPEADVYLVANIQGNPSAKDGNGFISHISLAGEVIALKWIDGEAEGVTLDAPKGMALAGERLFVADIDVVRVFDRESGDSLDEIPVEGARFLNDVAAAEDGMVYVTDSGTGVIHRIRPDGTLEQVGQTKNPNGIHVRGETILVTGGSNQIFRLGDDGALTPEYETPAGGLDGLILLDDGSVLVSSWMGAAVYQFDADGQVSTLFSGINAPADIGFDSQRGSC